MLKCAIFAIEDDGSRHFLRKRPADISETVDYARQKQQHQQQQQD